jgi:hypothetical protein
MVMKILGQTRWVKKAEFDGSAGGMTGRRVEDLGGQGMAAQFSFGVTIQR